jgi:hypothetical protein
LQHCSMCNTVAIVVENLETIAAPIDGREKAARSRLSRKVVVSNPEIALSPWTARSCRCWGGSLIVLNQLEME